MNELNRDNPMKNYSTAWLNVLQTARSHKEEFDQDARDAMGFFDGSSAGMWSGMNTRGIFKGEDQPKPDCRVTINKTYEAVSIFGPSLYYQNPHRQVNPRTGIDLPRDLFGPLDDPYAEQQYMMFQQEAMASDTTDRIRATLLEKYLNYTPNELDLIGHMRRAVDEAIIKGMSVLWTEVYQRPGSPTKMIGSFWDNINNVLVDPDMPTIEDANWIARRCVHPVWEVEDDYGLPRGSLKPNIQSSFSYGANKDSTDYDHQRMKGQTNDLIEYWKVYSKMGMGDLMREMPEELKGVLDDLGPNVYLVVAKGVDFPLNLPPEIQEMADPEEIFQRVQWPTPFWADGRWPCVFLKWRDVPGKLYPMGLIKPAMGELNAINWVASHLMGKIRTTSRDFMVTLSKASSKIKEQLSKGRDLTLLELDSSVGDDINKVVQFLQHPEMNGDIWRVQQMYMELFEQRTGLSEVLYGQNPGGVQSRSAADAQNKMRAASVRPDDMARVVEQFATELARQEAIAARYHLSAQDVLPILGRQGAMLWEQFVSAAPLDTIISETEYRVESGSARKPNKDRDVENVSQAMQVLAPILMGNANMTGNFGPINELIARWGHAMDFPAEALMMAPPPMPQMMPPEDGGDPNQQPAPVAA